MKKSDLATLARLKFPRGWHVTAWAIHDYRLNADAEHGWMGTSLSLQSGGRPWINVGLERSWQERTAAERKTTDWIATELKKRGYKREHNPGHEGYERFLKMEDVPAEMRAVDAIARAALRKLRRTKQ